MKNIILRGRPEISKRIFGLYFLTLALLPAMAVGQLNSGSNGSDGALNPTTNIVINMADHPDGIYQYMLVNIPSGVTVTFIPNANNTPVVWLVQSNCVINGTVDLSGQSPSGAAGGLGGPGGYRGGTGGPSPTAGQGPGGGLSQGGVGGNASFGSQGQTTQGVEPGPTYGNSFLIPLLGGSGGGGTSFVGAIGGSGGGGSILIAASGQVEINGNMLSVSPYGWWVNWSPPGVGGAGSGGAVRVVASKIMGSGKIRTIAEYWGVGGSGRLRFDTYENNFGGNIYGVFSQGSQFIVIPSTGQLPQLNVTSVGGVPVSASPTGQLSTPDAVLSAQQNNPIPIVVHCSNIPLNTQITVNVKPVTAVAVSGIGVNDTGTFSSSTATILVNMPRGGGLIHATAAISN